MLACGDNGTEPKRSEEGTLLVQTRDGIIAVSLDATKTLFNEATGRQVEVLDTHIFIGPSGTTAELDHEGGTIRSIPRPAEIPGATTFVVLPDTGFAFISNSKDSIYFMDITGAFVTADSLPVVSVSKNINMR